MVEKQTILVRGQSQKPACVSATGAMIAVTGGEAFIRVMNTLAARILDTAYSYDEWQPCHDQPGMFSKIITMKDGTEAIVYQQLYYDDPPAKTSVTTFITDNGDRQRLKYGTDAAVDALRKQGSTNLDELQKIYDAWRAEAATHIAGIVEHITAAQTWHEFRQARSCFFEMIPSFGRWELWQFTEISSASTETANRLHRANRRDYMRSWRARNPEKARQQSREAQRRYRKFWAPIRAAGMAALMLAALWP